MILLWFQAFILLVGVDGKGHKIVVLKSVLYLFAMFFVLLIPLISSENNMHLGFSLESDGRNPALFMLKNMFWIIPSFLPMYLPLKWGYLYSSFVHPSPKTFFNIFIYAYCSFFHTVLESLSMCLSMYWRMIEALIWEISRSSSGRFCVNGLKLEYGMINSEIL